MFDNNRFNYSVTSAKPYFCHHVQVFGGFSYRSQRCFMEELVGLWGLWWSHRPIHGFSKSLVVFHINSGDLSFQRIVEFLALWWVLRLASNLSHGFFFSLPFTKGIGSILELLWTSAFVRHNYFYQIRA